MHILLNAETNKHAAEKLFRRAQCLRFITMGFDDDAEYRRKKREAKQREIRERDEQIFALRHRYRKGVIADMFGVSMNYVCVICRRMENERGTNQY